MAEQKQEKVTIVMFSGELDKALAGFIIATTAASMGMKVTMFFTFWGLNIIKKNEGSLKSSGWKEKMFNMMNRGGSKRLKLSHFHMMGIGTSMIKGLMKKNKVPQLEELIKMAKQMDVEMIACTTTCGLMGGLEEPAFIPEAQVLAGAAYFLGEARDSKITLFI